MLLNYSRKHNLFDRQAEDNTRRMEEQFTTIMANPAREELAFKVTTDCVPSSSNSQTHQLTVNFILENNGQWVIDPRDNYVSTPSHPLRSLRYPTTTSLQFKLVPSADENSWLTQACLGLLRLGIDPTFHNHVLSELEAQVKKALGEYVNSTTQVYDIDLNVRIKLYTLYEICDQDRESSLMSRKYSGCDVIGRRIRDESDDWVLVVGRMDHIQALEIVRELVSGQCEDCAVCIREMRGGGGDGGSIVRLLCKHVFHEGCVCEWFKRQPSCPICRFDCSVI